MFFFTIHLINGIFILPLGIGVNIPEVGVDLLDANGQLYDFASVTEGLDLTTNDGRNRSQGQSERIT